MNFTILEKKRTDSWLDQVHILDKANDKGLVYSIEIDGNSIDKSSVFMVITNERIEYLTATHLLQIAYEEKDYYFSNQPTLYIERIDIIESECFLTYEIKMYSKHTYSYIDFLD